MELTRKQQEGLDIAVDRYKRGEKYTVISGYAGTGKSTLVKYIIAALQVDPEKDVVYTAYTGKATQVLLKKGNKKVRTLHKLLYLHFPKPDGTFARRPKESIEEKVVVVDEVSMVPQAMMDLLFSHNIYVLCCGDPFQLPPILTENKNEVCPLLQKPHIFLDEIMRQASDSEIIQLSMAIREQKTILPMSGSEVQVIRQKDMVSGMLTWADQVIVATNNMRKSLNSQIRALNNRGPMPEPGDKVICNKNYWDYASSCSDLLVNGTIGYLGEDIQQKNIIYPRYLCPKMNIKYIYGSLNIETYEGENEDEKNTFEALRIDSSLLIDEKSSLTPRERYSLERSKQYRGSTPLEFYYGYAITCHKSQGSEWEKGLVIEERFPFDKVEHARWLYTAVTRFSDKLVLVIK